MEFKNVICLNCGWVSFGVSTEYVRSWKKDWVVFWNKMDQRGRDMYGCSYGPPDESEYLSCQRCGGSHHDFRDALPEEMPYGSTIGPILNRDEEYTDEPS